MVSIFAVVQVGSEWAVFCLSAEVARAGTKRRASALARALNSALLAWQQGRVRD